MQDLVPGKLADSDPPPPAVQKAKRNVYRTTQECLFLDLRLIEWLQHEHLADSWCTVRPPDLILSETQRACKGVHSLMPDLGRCYLVTDWG